MTLSLIIAIDKNGLIGNKGTLPWHLPEDLKRFKKITMGHPIIMGRKTFESIGRVLPGRRNIVVTRNSEWRHPDVTVVHSLEEALTAVQGEDEAFIIGGAELFKATIKDIQKIYLTEIHESFEGDVYLPELDLASWRTIHSEEFPKDGNTPYAYRFRILKR